ncbi:MAG: DUF2325 domain-containing protein [Nitrosomonas sp.]|nr:DUF2325 domain-containing protein [Nitrosomonas sp.]
MKFLKKLALANNNSSGTLSHYHSPDFAYTNIFLSFCLCNLEKLANRLNKYLFIRKKANSRKQKLDSSNQKIINTRTSIVFRSAQVTDWAPLIKTAPSTKNRSGGNRANDYHQYHLAGRSVLCVGGRLKLYPEYHQLIKNSGGHLMTFHGDSNDPLDHLPRLLEKADMIICPVDCVNHQAFFIVKYYCKYSGKPCVLLDRSEAHAFYRGINMLATLAADRVLRINLNY